jgi:hypothetical protein
MKCPKCKSEECSVITETTTKGKDYSAGKGCLGAMLFGYIGLLCGACGKGKEIRNTHYWVCHKCGHKWKM